MTRGSLKIGKSCLLGGLLWDFGKDYTQIKARFWLDFGKIAQFRLFRHQTQAGANAGDLNEREWILRVVAVYGYPLQVSFR